MYAVFTTQPIKADIDLIAELAALTGKTARELSPTLSQGGQLSAALSKYDAETLSSRLSLLGIQTEIREASFLINPRRPHQQEQNLETQRPIQTAKTKAPVHPLVLGIIVLSLCSIMFMAFQSKQSPLESQSALGLDAPLQRQSTQKPWFHNDYLFTPLASYELEARVLSLKQYRLSRGAKLSPVDAALGWGPMSDLKVTNQLNVTQRNRWYYVSWPANPPLSPASIMNNSANTHLIPANEEIAKKIKSLSKHDMIQLKGYLVNISATDGFYWNSSTSRLDRGDGACEVFWVEAISLVSESL